MADEDEPIDQPDLLQNADNDEEDRDSDSDEGFDVIHNIFNLLHSTKSVIVKKCFATHSYRCYIVSPLTSI